MTLFSYEFFGDDGYDDEIYTVGVVAATDKKKAEETVRKQYKNEFLDISGLRIDCLYMCVYKDREFIAEIDKFSR